MIKEDKRLTRLFAKYNKDFFDNELPHDTRVSLNDELDNTICGLTLTVEDEETKHKFYIIYINPSLHATGEHARMTLLHEMVHVKIGPKHGRKFQEEMLRLAGRAAFRDLW